MNFHEIYYENRFLKCSKTFQKLLLLTGRKWQDSFGTKFRSEWEKCFVNVGEWLEHLDKQCSIFWSCLQFVLLGRCWKFSWSIIMEYPLLSDIPRSKLWVSFLFPECRYKKKKFRLSILVGHGYVSFN